MTAQVPWQSTPCQGFISSTTLCRQLPTVSNVIGLLSSQLIRVLGLSLGSTRDHYWLSRTTCPIENPCDPLLHLNGSNDSRHHQRGFLPSIQTLDSWEEPRSGAACLFASSNKHGLALFGTDMPSASNLIGNLTYRFCARHGRSFRNRASSSL